MKERFEVLFLEEVEEFLDELDDKTREKIIYNVDKSRFFNDPELFKKLNDTVWEFRTRFKSKQYRLLAFWDKRKKTDTLVIATHGFVKKSQKTPKKEIEKTEQIAKAYLAKQN